MSKPAKDASPDAALKLKRRQEQARDGLKAAAEYEAATVALRAKTAKLREQRLAREAEAAAQAAANPPDPVKKKSNAKKKGE